MELSGTIKAIFDEKQISSSFRKREVVLTTEDRYPQQILVEFTQDKIQLLESYKIGDQVRIAINIRGREWTSPSGDVKYFVSIQGWKIENQARDSAGGPIGEPPSDDVPFPESPAGGAPPRDDDIPF